MRQSQSRASSILIFTKAGQKSSSLSLCCQLIQHAPSFRHMCGLCFLQLFVWRNLQQCNKHTLAKHRYSHISTRAYNSQTRKEERDCNRVALKEGGCSKRGHPLWISNTATGAGEGKERRVTVTLYSMSLGSTCCNTEQYSLMNTQMCIIYTYMQ